MTNILATLAAAAAGGFLFAQIHIPLPWMLGPLVSVIALSRLNPARVCWPQSLRNLGLVILGYVMGRPFTTDVGLYVLAQLPLMLAMTMALILFSLAVGYITHRQTGLTLATAVLATVPGGLSQMVVLGEEIASADVSVVTFMQTIRMLAVVFTVPFLAMHGLAGAAGPAAAASAAFADISAAAALPFLAALVLGTWLAVRSGLPTPYLLGPVLATAALVLAGLPAPSMPPVLIIVAQIFIGAAMGLNMNLSSLSSWRLILICTLVNVAAVILLALLIGYFLAGAIPTTLVTAFLSAAPGGMAEMGVTALAVGADVSVVVGYHMFRLLFILLVLPLFLRYWLGRPRGEEI